MGEGIVISIGIFVSILLVFYLYKRYFSNRNNTNQNLMHPEVKTKNTWLYTTDNFGKMEKGVVNRD